jgi:nucleoid-associated protein YgaU
LANPDFSNVQGGVSSTATTGDFTEYTVKKGDSLSAIAKREYGDMKLWKTIYEANRDVIKNPDLIEVGWKLKLPRSPAPHSA